MIELLTAILVAITGVYAWLTWRIAQANQEVVHASREQTHLSLRPYVHFDFQFTGPMIEIVLKNTGRTAATNVTIKLETPLNVVGPAAFSGPPRCVSFPITQFPPDKTIVEMVCSWQEFEEQIKNYVVKGTICYSGPFDNIYEEPFAVDLNYRRNSLHVGRKDIGTELEKVVKALDSINRTIEKVKR